MPSARPGTAIERVRAMLEGGGRICLFLDVDGTLTLGSDIWVSGPTNLPAPAGVKRVDVESAREMLDASEAALPLDVAVMVAAVADWRPTKEAKGKIKKDAAGVPAIALQENPDILATLSKLGKKRPKLVVGFAAETDHVEEHARAKIAKKGCDWIVANDVSGDVMGGSHNRVHLVSAGSVESWDETSKENVAARLVDYIANRLAN